MHSSFVTSRRRTRKQAPCKARRRRQLLFESLEHRHLLATISGTVFVDHNGNGLIDTGEEPAPGRTVFIDANQDGQFNVGELSQITDAAGDYEFIAAPSGTHRVTLEDAIDFEQVFPSETASGSFLIDVANRRGHVFDARRGLLYIATSDGLIQRFDVASRTLLEPFHVSGGLNHIDISPDAKFLYAAEAAIGINGGFIRRVDLSDGQVANFDYDRVSIGAPFDIGVTSNGKVLMTTYHDHSIQSLPLRELDPATGTFRGLRNVSERTHLAESADRDYFFVATRFSGGGAIIFTYHEPSDTISPIVQIDDELVLPANTAANRDGTRFALEYQGKLTVFDRNLNIVHQDVQSIYSGVAFDPLRDLLYVGDSSQDQVVALDTNSFSERFRLNVGEDLALGYRHISTSDDGEFLFVDTAAGVRMLTIGAPTYHTVNVFGSQVVSNINFGIDLQNYAPLAADDTVLVDTIAVDNQLLVLANDQLRSGGSLSITAVGQPDFGQATIGGGGTHLLYQPAFGFIGIDTLEYTVSDGQGREESASVTITVKPLDGFGVIQGRLWQDHNGNSHYDPGIDLPHFGPGWAAYLDLNNNSFPDVGEPVDETDPEGRYGFVMPPGDYTVRRLGSPEFKQWNHRTGVRQSVFLSSPFAQSHLFDPRRGLLYISTSDGWLQRYNVVQGEFIEPWHVGASLGEMDRTDLSEFLYVAELLPGSTQSLVHKVDLGTGMVSNVALDHNFAPGVWDVAGNTQRMFVTLGDTNTEPLYEITQPGDMVTSPRSLGGSAQLADSQYGSLLFIAESNFGTGDIRIADLATGQLSPAVEAYFSLGGTSMAVSADGSLIAVQVPGDGTSMLSSALPFEGRTEAIFSSSSGGVAFDPIRPVLYVGDATTNQVIAYDINQHHELFRTDVPRELLDEQGKISVSDDGQLLFVSVAGGVWMADLMNVLPYQVTVSPDEIVQGIDFELNFPAIRSLAIDDVYEVANDQGPITLDVQENDIGLREQTIDQVNTVVTQGSVSILNGKQIIYTPAPGFVGTDRFLYFTHDGLNEGLAGAEVVVNVTASTFAAIRGIVWDDLDGDGQFEPLAGETPREGISVYVDVNSNGQAEVNEIVQTDAQGEYVFPDLPAGTYTVGQLDPAGLVLTTPLKAGSENVLIPLPTARGHVFDHRRNIHYIATSTGNIERYDVAAQTLLAPLEIRAELRSIDIARNAAFLLAGDPNEINNQGVVYKINLFDGTTEQFVFGLVPDENGIADLVLTQRGSALISMFIIGSTERLREMQLDGTVTQRTDTASVRTNARLHSSANDALVFIMDPGVSSGPIRSYNAVTDAFSPVFGVGIALTNATAAVAPDGLLIATTASNLSLLSPDLQTVNVLTPVDGGLAFDTLRSLLYGVDTDTDEVVVLEVPSGRELFRVPLGEDVAPSVQETSVSPDGRLFVSTPSGVRMLRPTAPGTHTVVLNGTGQDATGIDFGYRHDGSNRAPQAVPDSYTLSEDIPLQVAAPGMLANDLDPDSDPLTAMIVQAPQHGQLVSFVDGSFVYIPDPNYSGQDAFIYQASDGYALSLPSTVTLTIENVNDPPSNIQLSNSSVDENAAGVVIGDITVTDDAGDTHTLSVADARFEIVNQQLRLRSGESLDFEAGGQVVVTITATDQGGAALEEDITIQINDLNEPPVLTVGSQSIDEGVLGAIIGDVTLTDPDTGQTHSFTVSDSRFEVVGGKLKLMPDQALNYEAETSVEIVVTVTDSGSPAMTDNVTVTVHVNDINDPPTLTVPQQPSVDENVAGALLGPVSMADEDSGQTLALLISDDRFEVVGGNLKLKDSASLDFEAAASVLVEVTAQDSGTPSQSTTETVTVTVNNVNEAPAITLAAAAINENEAGGIIGAVTLSDPDQGQTHTIAITDDRFEVAGGQLKLKNGVALNYEAEASVTFDVTVTDSGSPALNDQQTWTITVLDVDEAPTAIELSTSSIPENAQGAVVGQVSVTDPDAADLHDLTVSDNRFEIVAGELRLKAGVSLDFEATPSVLIELAATDRDDASLAINVPFVITVTNVNEPPEIVAPLADRVVLEYQRLEVQLDPDAFQDPEGGPIVSLNVLLAGGSPLPTWLTYDPATHTLLVLPKRADLGAASLLVSAMDQDGLVGNATLNIDVLASPAPYQNPVDPLDVSGGDGVFAVDVLLVINFINLFGPRPLQAPDVEDFEPPPFLDVSGDNFVSAVDPLLVINFINARVAGAEGELPPMADAFVVDRQAAQRATGSPLEAALASRRDLPLSPWSLNWKSYASDPKPVRPAPLLWQDATRRQAADRDELDARLAAQVDQVLSEDTGWLELDEGPLEGLDSQQFTNGPPQTMLPN